MKKIIALTALLLAAPAFAVEKVSGITEADLPAKTPAVYYGKQMCVSGQLGTSKTLPGTVPGFASTLGRGGQSINIIYFRKIGFEQNKEIIACGIFREKETIADTAFTNVLRASSLTATITAPTVQKSTAAKQSGK